MLFRNAVLLMMTFSTGVDYGIIGNPAAAASGKLNLLPLGHYACAYPGRADGAARISTPEYNFTVRNGSTYRTDAGTGTYLMAGDAITFTSGPMKHARFDRTGRNTIRLLDEGGKYTRVRCIRRVARR